MRAPFPPTGTARAADEVRAAVDVNTGNARDCQAAIEDRFIAGPDHAMDWVIDYNTKYSFPEVCTPPGPGDSGCRHG